MTNENYDQHQKKWTACERWHLTGHSLLAIGTLCISIANLLQLASTGKINEFSGYQPTGFGRSPSHQNQNSYDGISANEYFRRG